MSWRIHEIHHDSHNLVYPDVGKDVKDPRLATVDHQVLRSGLPGDLTTEARPGPPDVHSLQEVAPIGLQLGQDGHNLVSSAAANLQLIRS